MPSFCKGDLRLRTLITSNGERFLIAEYIDEYDTWAMSFVTFRHGMYEVMNLPQGFKPSYELCTYLWNLLETTDCPSLTIPSGYYYGEDFYTHRGTIGDTTLIEGEEFEKVYSPDGTEFSLVISQQGPLKIGFFGYCAGIEYGDNNRVYTLWWPTLIPKSIKSDDGIMLTISGALELVEAKLIEINGQVQ